MTLYVGVLFQFQQKLFYLQTACIACELAACPDYSVAWDNNRDRIFIVCHADSSAGFNVARFLGKLFIGDGLAVGNVLKFAPNKLLKLCAAKF